MPPDPSWLRVLFVASAIAVIGVLIAADPYAAGRILSTVIVPILVGYYGVTMIASRRRS